jgi:hypothetical protein
LNAGDSAQSKGTKEPAKASSALAPAQLKIAHFLSEDGTIGFVLDRSGSPAKVRFDGEKDIIELTFEEDLRAGERRGIYYRRPDGRNVLYISSLNGSIKVFTPTSGLFVRSDRNAPPLPKSTVKGQYKPPKSMYEMAVEELTPRSVMAKFPRFRPEDSGNLTEVAKAFKVIDATMLVRINGTGSANAQWAPASQRIGDVTQGLGGGVSPWPLRDRKWDRNATGLARYGAILVDDHPEFAYPSRLKLMALDGWPAPLAPDTPGIIWAVYDGMLIFVTLDGGRYQISLSGTDENSGYPVTLGLAPEACWPAPLQHSLVDVDTIRGLVKGEAIPDKVGEGIEALDDGWFRCVNGVWQSTRTELEKIEALALSQNEKDGRLVGAKKAASQQAIQQCDGEKAKLEKGLVAFIEARDTERINLYEKVKNRVRSLVPAPAVR